MAAHSQVPVPEPTSLGRSETGNNKPMLNHPFAWTVFAWILLVVPVAGFLITSGWPWSSVHPAVNAALNASSLFFLCVGVVAIKNKNQVFHRKCMLSAFSASSVFLVSYLARAALTGTHTFQGVGVLKTLYLVILFSHMIWLWSSFRFACAFYFWLIKSGLLPTESWLVGLFQFGLTYQLLGSSFTLCFISSSSSQPSIPRE